MLDPNAVASVIPETTKGQPTFFSLTVLAVLTVNTKVEHNRRSILQEGSLHLDPFPRTPSAFGKSIPSLNPRKPWRTSQL